jgi:hypothetical protein
MGRPDRLDLLGRGAKPFWDRRVDELGAEADLRDHVPFVIDDGVTVTVGVLPRAAVRERLAAVQTNLDLTLDRLGDLQVALAVIVDGPGVTVTRHWSIQLQPRTERGRA